MCDHEPAEIDAKASPAVLRVLVENHRDFLRFLEKRVGSRAVAEDILQDAFARGLDRLDSLRTEESAVAWFYRILRNAIIDHRRRDGARTRALDSFAAEVEKHVEPDIEVKNVICRCVGELATTLKPEYAEALEHVEVEGLPVKDFAERAGISSNNAAIRVFRAREALRNQVARSCGTCAEHGCRDCTCDMSGGHRS
jgi:RNA polymerase sigma factor (sigma-70 family)